MSLVITPKRWGSKPPLGTKIRWGHPHAAGLMACWTFNSQGSLLEDAANGQYNIVTTSTSVSRKSANLGNGLYGSVIDSDGSSTVGGRCPTSIVFGASATWDAWVIVRTNPTGGGPLLMDSNGNLGPFILNAASPYVLIFGGGVNINGSITFPSNQWVHLAYTQGGGTGRLYVNGKADTTGAASTPTLTNLFDDVSTDRFDGQCYLMRVWGVSLPATVIYELAQLPKTFEMFQPQSPQQRYWVSTGAVVNTDPPYGFLSQPTRHYLPEIVTV